MLLTLMSLVLSRVMRQRTKSQVARRHARTAGVQAELQRGHRVCSHASLVQGHSARRVGRRLGSRRACRPMGCGQAAAMQQPSSVQHWAA